MAFSGGTFSRTFDCTTDRDNGVKILASKFDTELDGMATGLSTCILKDGTQTCTAAIPFAQGITLPDDKTITFGTNSDVLIQYDETTTNSLKISAAEGAGLAITLMADEGDDAGDEWKLNIADGGTLTLGNDINSAGTYVTHLTITPNATVANSTMAVAGNLTVGGALTLGSGAVISEAELETIDGITPGTVLASKAMIVDANKDITGGRNLTITGELDAATLDISGNADIDGTLEADAMTLDGTAITATATLDTGISNNNVPKFTTGAADNDFLRIDGTAIEGRSASEVLSDIAAAPAAGSSNIVTTGALNSGSITSGFGAIDNGSSAITTTGTITGGSVVADGLTIGTSNLDMNGNELILDADADTSITSDTDDQIDFRCNGVDRLIIGADGSLTSQPAASGTIVFNEASNDVDFRIESDANTHAFFLEGSSGNVGIGASSPSSTFRTSIRGDGSSIIGGIEFGNAASGGGETFTIGHASATSTSGKLNVVGAGNLVFATNNTEVARMDSTGGLRVGINSHIFNSAALEQASIKNPGQGNALTLQSTNISGGFPILYLFSSDSTASQNAIVFQRSGGGVGTITTSASATAYNTSSDYRLKTAVNYDFDATTRLKQLKPARFKWIVDGDDAVFVDGFLAHEAQAVVPEAVTGTKDETRDVENVILSSEGVILHRGIAEADWTAGKLATTDDDGNTVDALYPSDSTWAASHTEDVMQGIDQSKLVPLLVKTILELEARITALEA